MTFTDILYDTDGPIATITLNRPEYRNAQSYQMLDEIDDGVRPWPKADDEVRVVIVRGSGGVVLHRPRPGHAGGRGLPRRRAAQQPGHRDATTSSRSTTSTCC